MYVIFLMLLDKSVPEGEVPGREKVEHDHSKDDRTVFVSNLAFTTDESNLKEFFSDAGTISELRLVKDFKGRSKGYAYVVFQSRVRQHALICSKCVFWCFHCLQKLNLFN